jgi:[acyl-carrier-protein] S-malonyltransferase
MPYCIVFPGQGTQFKGMAGGLNLADIPDELGKLMAEGPEEELNLTTNAQPAVLSVSITLWKDSGFDSPAIVMGHSLGEYSALVASGALTLADAIALVKKRGEFMQASPSGSMAAIMGITEADLADTLNRIENVYMANINGAGQIVISGTKDGIERAVPLLKEKKARVVPLSVSVASHCPLMNDASEKLSEYLDKIQISKPVCDIVFNATAGTESDPAQIKSLLKRQLTSPVRWAQSVEYAVSRGIDTFIEIGPRSVLAALIKKIVPGIRCETLTVKQ